MAPEYLTHGQLTKKAHVYSFGVLLMEIGGGKQNNNRQVAVYTDSLLNEAWKHFQSETIEELVDPNILLHNNQYRDNIVADISRVVHVALLCTQENPLLRSPMSKTLHMLLKKDEQLPMPTKPTFTDEKTMELNSMCEVQ